MVDIKPKNKKFKQMSDAFVTAIFITISGGFQDAYTYILRDNVFANAQTGNIVLMSSYFIEGKYINTLHYLIPICAFLSGIFIAEVTHRKFKYIQAIHWRQIILIVEILLLFLVGFISCRYNTIANSLVSFVCAMQVQTFRKVTGKPYASTMCIGNIRSGTEAFCSYLYTKDKSKLKSCIEYFAVIFLFAVGAAIGCIFTEVFGTQAIWFSCIMLMISFCLMFKKQ